MEEQILKILNEKIELSLTDNFKSVYIDGLDNTAKEITSHVFEFIEWLDFGIHDFYLNAEKDQTGYYQEGSHTIYTIEEVYDYWFKNIKSK